MADTIQELSAEVQAQANQINTTINDLVTQRLDLLATRQDQVQANMVTVQTNMTAVQTALAKALLEDSDNTITGTYTFDTTPIVTNEAQNDSEVPNLAQVNTLIANASLGGGGGTPVDLSDYVTKTGASTITGQVTFDTTPVVTNDAVNDNEVPNLAQVNTLIANSGGGTTAPTNVVLLDTDQTIDGNKTFTNPVIVPNATQDTEAVNKGQMDAAIAAVDFTDVVLLNTDQTIDGNKTFTNPVIVPDATQDTEAVNKGQMDAAIAAVGGGGTTAPTNVVLLDTDQTIDGSKTFLQPVIIPDATEAHHAVSQEQVQQMTQMIIGELDKYAQKAEATTISGEYEFTASPTVPMATADMHAVPFAQMNDLLMNIIQASQTAFVPVAVTGAQIDFSQGFNFDLTVGTTATTITSLNHATSVGKTGVIIVKANADQITWGDAFYESSQPGGALDPSAPYVWGYTIISDGAQGSIYITRT